MKMTAPLKENHLFRRAYNKGKTAADSRLALYVRRNGQRPTAWASPCPPRWAARWCATGSAAACGRSTG